MKLLIIQQKMIGDVLITSILCNNLRKAYPNAQIDYMVYKSTSAILDGNKSISNLILFEEKHRTSKFEFLKFLIKIRKTKYDVVIDAYTKIESFLPVIFSGAKTKISFYKKYRSLIFNKLVEKSQIPTSTLGLIIEQRLSLLKPLNLNITIDNFPVIYVSKEEEVFAKNIFQKNAVNSSKKTLMLSIIGSSNDKTYPAEYMVELIETLVNKYEVNILFNYIPSQIKLADEIFELCSKAAQSKIYFNVLGKNIREFIAIMNQCDAIIGNDGGAINIAKALNKPSFIIFSPWIDKKGWATFEDGIKNVSVHLSEFKPHLFENKSAKEIYKINSELYLEFNPDLFKLSFEKFCKNHLA